MVDTNIEASSNRGKKLCKFGSKCRRKKCNFAHPNDATDTATTATKKSNDALPLQEISNTTSNNIQQLSSLPLEITCLLENLLQRNDATLEVIAANAVVISKLQGENASLLNTTQAIRRDLDKLQEEIKSHLDNSAQNVQFALAADVEQEAIAKQQLETRALNAERRLEKEQSTSQRLEIELKLKQDELESLQGELEASKDLVRQQLTLGKSGNRKGNTSSSKSSGTELAATTSESRESLAIKNQGNFVNTNDSSKALGNGLAVETATRPSNEKKKSMPKKQGANTTPATDDSWGSPIAANQNFGATGDSSTLLASKNATPSNAANKKSKDTASKKPMVPVTPDTDDSWGSPIATDDVSTGDESSRSLGFALVDFSQTGSSNGRTKSTDITNKRKAVVAPSNAPDPPGHVASKKTDVPNKRNGRPSPTSVVDARSHLDAPAALREPQDCVKTKQPSSVVRQDESTPTAVSAQQGMSPPKASENVLNVHAQEPQEKEDKVSSKTMKKELVEAKARKAAAQRALKMKENETQDDPSSVKARMIGSVRLRAASSITRKNGASTTKKPLRRTVVVPRLANERLSLYLFPKKRNTKSFSVSPIFELLQNPATLGIARQVLTYESEMLVRKNELVKLEEGKRLTEASIQKENRKVEKYSYRLERYDEEYQSYQESWGLFDGITGAWKTYVAPVFSQQKDDEEAKDYYEIARRELLKEKEEEKALKTRAEKKGKREQKAEAKKSNKKKKALASKDKDEAKVSDLNGETDTTSDHSEHVEFELSNAWSHADFISLTLLATALADLSHSDDEKFMELETTSEELADDWNLVEYNNLYSLQASIAEVSLSNDAKSLVISKDDVPNQPDDAGEFEPTAREIEERAVILEVKDRKRAVLENARAAKKKKEMESMTRKERTATLNEIVDKRKGVKDKQDEARDRIKALQIKFLEWDEPILAKKRQITEITTKVSELTGRGQENDDFRIDGSRNEHGHTFLMVAAQNNDVETARVCLLLGADPNVLSPEGFTAMSFAHVFKFREMMDLLSQNGATYPKRQVEAWEGVLCSSAKEIENPVDWDVTLRIAEQAAIPMETILGSANALEASKESRMAVLSKEERSCREFVFFDKSVADFQERSMRRTVLLSEDVYRWFCDSEASSKAALLSLLDALKPDNLRRQQSCGERAICTRRSVVGMKKTYEVLCAPMGEGSNLVCLFTPFVTSAVEGVADVGVLVWAITASHNASLIKTLIEKTEFLRHKVVDDDEVFPPHDKEVLELGKDVHLLDLHSTSIFTSKPLELYILDVDEGDIERLDEDDFVPKRRIAYYEQQLNRAIFEGSEEEARENAAILSGERAGMSTSLIGGAGTGKTLLMTKKIISVPRERKVLVVSRLPRLISVIKGAVERERGTGNVTFSTYDDLLSLLTRSVTPPNEMEDHGFSTFNKVQFESNPEVGGETSVSFVDGFVGSFLGEKERKTMKASLVERITLWTAIRTIKSSARCSTTKQPLSREEYMELPKAFGLTSEQRTIVYDLYVRYEQWLKFEGFKWDEADRVLYILKYGPSVFSESTYKSWETRAYHLGQMDLLEEDGWSPLSPFFFELVFADEAQDFTEIDLALLLRMSSGVRSLFLGSDPAQSVELGIRMRAGTINDVFHSSLSSKGKHVKNVLQQIQMRSNHRTHAQNLALATAVRSIMARSFGMPLSNENALINGPIPEGLSLELLSDLANEDVFVGGNIVFITPDEVVDELRSQLRELGVQNDVFGVREAKGLEFNDVALIGFFSYIDELGSSREWENCLRWLSSATSLSFVQSGEKVLGKQLESCDYTLSHPEVLDQAMLLYTALTRARNHLYLIEIKELRSNRDQALGGKRASPAELDDFAFRRFKDLGLIKTTKSIHEGLKEMTPAQHKARGVLLVTQAINLSRSGNASMTAVKEKFLEAAQRFRADKGNDKELLDQCVKHMDAILLKRKLMETVEKKFFDRKNGRYILEGRFADILSLEQDCSKFFSLCIGDSFLVDEIASIRKLMEEMFVGTPYYIRFGEICQAIKQHEP